MESWKERIDQYVDRKGPDECWEWKGHRGSNGYGVAYCQGLQMRAHRVAYMLAKGDIPEGLIILHKCDNPPCCNPAHLRLGTFLDNAEDAINKGRLRFKLSKPPSKTPGQIRREFKERIRADLATKDASAWLTTGQAAVLASVSAQTIINWIDSGRIPARRIGAGPRKLDRQEFIRYLEGNGVSVQDPATTQDTLSA
jgi:excisionase family DNA binding protein